jgi:tubulin beta
MGTKFWDVVCDEHDIGSSGEYCGYSDAHLDRIYVFYHESWAASAARATS